MEDLLVFFDNRLKEFRQEDIIKLSEIDNSIFNVVRGLHKEAFGVLLMDDEIGNNFNYDLIYITASKNGTLEGVALSLQPLLEKRNELTTCFVAYLCKRYGFKDYYKIFNTYQFHQQTLLERMGYWTYDDIFLEEIKGEKFTLLIKSQKGALYIPIADKRKDRKKSAKNFVYIMQNRQNNYYKIGRSIDTEHREKTLQSQEPDIVLIEKWSASAEVEIMLHRRFKEKRLRGEWFKLTDDDLEEIRAFMESYLSSTNIST